MVQTNAATAEENSATSGELSAQAAMLRQEVQRFKLRERGAGRIPATMSYREDFTALQPFGMTSEKY